jgi:hypothetical protein
VSLIDHPVGDYRFLPGIAPYSCGVVASPGYEIVRVGLQRPIGYVEGLRKIVEYLEAEGRPRAAVCAIELRSPRPLSCQGFAEFNAGYAEILQSWDIFVDGVNPVARTNVAPVTGFPKEPALSGFAFTRPCPGDTSPTFVVAGAGELPEGVLSRDRIVALGDTSPAGLETKARFVLDLMETRLRGLGADWTLVTTIDVYTPHSLDRLLPDIILPRTGSAAVHGTTWHYSRPPIEEIEFEMDVRGTRTSKVISPG